MSLLSDEELTRLARLVDSQGWKQGFENYLRDIPANLIRIIRSEISMRHTGWRGLLPYNDHSRAVVMENGLGGLVVALAQSFDAVSAVYENNRIKDIVSKRCEYLNIKNVEHFVLTEGEQLPAIQPDVDAVTAYIENTTFVTPARIKALIRLLTTNGVAYFGIPNNGLTNRGTSHHRQWSATRSLHNVIRSIHRLSYKTRIYRYTGTLRDNFDIVAHNNDSGLAGYIKSILNRLGDKYYGRCYGVLAFKSNLRNTLFHQIIDNYYRILPKQSSDYPTEINRVVMSKPRGALLALHSPLQEDVIIRIPFDKITLFRCNNNAAALSRAVDLMPEGANCTPVLLNQGSVGTQNYFVESMLKGSNVSNRQIRNGARLKEIVAQALTMLIALQSKSSQRKKIDNHYYQDRIEQPLNRIKALFFSSTMDAWVSSIEKYLRTKLMGIDINTVLYHGDFSLDNILADQNTDHVTGIFDWEYAQQDGLPLMDMIYFFTNRQKRLDNSTIKQVFEQKIIPGRFTSEERSWLGRYRNALAIPEELQLALSILCLVNFAAYRMDQTEEYQQPAVYQQSISSAIEAAARMTEAEEIKG